jgi:hypothetical protein
MHLYSKKRAIMFTNKSRIDRRKLFRQIMHFVFATGRASFVALMTTLAVSAQELRPSTDETVRQLPSFFLLESNYPLGRPEVAKATIGGRVNLPWIVNTCVVRVSHSLNLAGERIPVTITGYQAEDFSVSGRAGLRYIFRITAMEDYLSRTYGPPTFICKYSSSEVRHVPTEIQQKQGIIIFKIPTLDDATGHVDLWDGEKCVYECWFAKADEVLFWECNQLNFVLKRSP